MASSPSGSGMQETVIDLIGEENDSPTCIDLHVKDLSYTVTDKPGSWWQQLTHLQMPWEWFEKGNTTQVFQNVSFSAKSGQLMAIMGGSGSGKTSLLDVLSYRTTTGTITGQVYLNPTMSTKTAIKACSGYVRQDDRLIGFLTARETLMFVARLKLPRTFSEEMIKRRVDLIIAELGLRHAADTKVGSATIRGLSGGERRRVSIGVQLLILPSILFLDEPTSGLDSFTASNLVKTLSRLALKKRTIIMSIHQPRFDIFNMVDTLMILSKGRIVYNGPGKEIVSYFTALGYPCPPHTNPCDFYIDLATVDSTSKEQEENSLQILERLHEAYKAIAETAEAAAETVEVATEIVENTAETAEVAKKEQLEASEPPVSDIEEERRITNGDIILQTSAYTLAEDRKGPRLNAQFVILFKRFVRVKADDYIGLLTHMVQALLMSLLLGLVYLGLKNDQQSFRDWLSIMFMISVMYPYMVILGLIGTCYEERRFLYFELQDSLYSPSAYYFAKIFSDVPFHLVYVLIYCMPVYGMAGLKADPYTCFMFYLIVSVSVFTSRSLAMMSAAIMPTYHIASMLAQILFSLFIMSAGFLINLDSMIHETKWISSISYLRWSYEALCIIGIEGLEFHCNTANCTSHPTINGSDVLKVYALGGVELWECAIGLGVSMLVFLSVMFIGVKFIPQKPHNE